MSTTSRRPILSSQGCFELKLILWFDTFHSLIGSFVPHPTTANHVEETNKLGDVGKDDPGVSLVFQKNTGRACVPTASQPASRLTNLCSGGAIIVGGPALTYWVSPTEEELFKKYNPDLQKKSLANRAERQKEFDDFVGKLKEYSKSDKPSMSTSSWRYFHALSQRADARQSSLC